MPELPEVETIVRDLRPDLQGRVILAAEVDWPRTVATSSIEAFQQRIAGQRIEAAGRRGKYITLQLSPGDWLLIHLKMTGHLQVMAPGERDASADKHVRAIFYLDDGRQLWFRNPRKFGRLHLTRDPGTLLGHLGPEPLADDFTLGAFAARIRPRRGRLKPLLVNQRFIAGLGNIYADEALFAAGLHPQRTADTLSDDEIAALYRAVRRVLQQGVDNRGTTLDDRGYRDAQGEAGSNQIYVQVYGRTDKPCVRCGTPVQRIVLGGRSAHFCPRCQPRQRATAACQA
jgi:formamidopyrimidine-DNA glycosylase